MTSSIASADAPPPLAPSPALAERLQARARGLVRDGKAMEALPLLDRLARIPGRAGDAAAALAEALLVLGRPAEAEAAATAMLSAGDAGNPLLLSLRAEARLARTDHRGALADAADLVIADPASPRAKALLGRALLAAARLEEAILLLGQAFAAAPHDSAVRITLAEALAAAGRQEDAEALLAAVDERPISAPQAPEPAGDPTLPEQAHHGDAESESPTPDAGTLLDAGIAALKSGRAGDAVLLLERVVAAERDPFAVLNLGLALSQTCRVSEAMPLLEEAAHALPGHPEPRFHLGRLRGLRGDGEGAARDFTAALALRPDHVPSLAALAALKEDAADWDAAADLIAAARAVEPAEPELSFAAGRLALRRDDAATAASCAAEVLGRRPAHAGAARLWAEAMLALHGAEAALAEVADRAAAEPFAACWPIAAAFLHGASGGSAAAIAELRLAEALAPEEGEIVAALGRALAGTDACAEAEATLRAAVALLPADLDLRNQLASVLWKAHKLSPMLEVLDAASREFGDHPALLLNHALALNACGEQDAALAAASRAAALPGGGTAALVTCLIVQAYHPREGTAAGLLRGAGEIAASLSLPVPPQRPPHRRTADPRPAGRSASACCREGLASIRSAG